MIYDLMSSRRSVRRFKAEAPPREMIERVLEAAITAPSASNKQPWKFLVVQDRALLGQIAAAVREAVARIAAHVPEESQGSFRAYGDYFTRFEQAPVVIVAIYRGLTVLSHLVDAAIDPDDRARVAAMERESGLTGTAMAIQNLLLMAHEIGLGASGMTGPLVAVDRIKALLEVPESWGVAALIPLGFPDETPAPTERKALAKVVRWMP